MKKISRILALCCAVPFLLPGIMRAQTITINSISGTVFCAGDPISVSFSASGSWLHTNAFTLQLSNASGSFSNGFLSIGSFLDTADGTFSIVSTLPTNIATSTHYRFRVIASKPYTASADNGSDVVIGAAPLSFYAYGTTRCMINVSCDFGIAQSPPPMSGKPNYESDTMYWDFGDGATPASAFGVGNAGIAKSAAYSTSGIKTVVVRVVSGPCGHVQTDTLHVKVLDCTSPVIPFDAVVISTSGQLSTYQTTHLSHWRYDTTQTGIDSEFIWGPDVHNTSFWINPGVDIAGSGTSGYTIYVEAGATLEDGGNNIVYLKPGAVFNQGNALVLYADGASVIGAPGAYSCPDITFDYSHAPPNSIMHVNGAVQSTGTEQTPVGLSPNPTSGMLTVQGAPTNARIQVMNVLGDAVREIPKTTDSNSSLDLSNLPSGTYYVRLTSNSGVMTKKVVKE